MAQSLLEKISPESSTVNPGSENTTLTKMESKHNFFKALEWKESKTTPLICITHPLSEKNKVTFIQEIMPGLLEQNLKLALLGVGTVKYQEYFSQLAQDHPEQIIILEGTDLNKAKLYTAADILLCPSDSLESQEVLQEALNHKVVPIAPHQKGLENYNAVQERGNAFLFESKSSWSLFAATIRALENFKFPYDWKNIQKSIL